MNDQNGTAQLRFLEETAIRLRQNGFTVEPIEDHHLPVRWEKGRLCRVSGKGSVLYRQECVDSVRAQDALQTVIDTAKMTTEYMAILETATLLKAGGLTGDYRVLADFGILDFKYVISFIGYDTLALYPIAIKYIHLTFTQIRFDAKCRTAEKLGLLHCFINNDGTEIDLVSEIIEIYGQCHCRKDAAAHRR